MYISNQLNLKQIDCYTKTLIYNKTNLTNYITIYNDIRLKKKVLRKNEIKIQIWLNVFKFKR